ncbi:MAG TPA: hypothetical protein VFA83_14555 [Acidimicrobiales bacterium]|nr:hypothetical protein [Acidimicrobiales bacterium]
MLSVHDITELVLHHLVLSEVSDAQADANLAQLIQAVNEMMSRPRGEVYWSACEHCGAWVSSELIGPDGAGFGDDSGFRCSDCRWGFES